ncbi:hypothetical protein AL755_08895 [Arthrobacter sp. ERGS1:01]|uniref:sensor histidine kinase n=1 Tax=Arthrobacter sp. ERGS1:01 TaxID=1704044 RepID=UPI0006CB61D9|nr:sensor histidine kinase [Arthrobacter sp. ERGS1:01]ALE05574.1 hypothetical protein AL755_08895 [Arthrobacter sp. ERGS1:01]
MSFSARMLLQQLLVIALMVVLATVVYGWLTFHRVNEAVGGKTLAVAQTVAEDDDLRAVLSAPPPKVLSPETLATGPVQQLAQHVRGRTGALFVVVTDRDGIRWAHPNPALLGRLVSTSPDAALSGQEVTTSEVGSLGPSVRSKVPVRSIDGTEIVGEVSVGYPTQLVLDGVVSSGWAIVGVGVGAMVLGAVGSTMLSRRLRRDTLGLEPVEIGTLVQDQEVVLFGVDEGVIGVGPDRRVTVCNAKARRLLDLDEPEGRTLAELGLPAAVPLLLDAGADDDGTAVQVVVSEHVLLVSARKVVRAGRDLGWVLMVRDRTDVQALTRQLDAVGALTTALRAQRHEFANRLHTVSGLLDIGRPDQAADYLHTTLESGPLKYPLENAALLSDTYLLAFLGAKSTQAAEKGVRLRLGAATLLHSGVSDAANVTTVLGNLVDNAVVAAVQGVATDRWVEVELLSDGTELFMTVADSGNGVEPDHRELAFREGFTTAPQLPDGHADGHGEGLGLALSRQIARIGGGDVWLLSDGGDGAGAVFAARLNNALDGEGGGHDG